MSKKYLSKPSSKTTKEITRNESMVTTSRGGRDEKPKENMKHLHYNHLWCEKCLSVYSGKKWRKDPKLLNEIRGDKKLAATCPACRQEENHVAEGVLYIKNIRSTEDDEGIMNLIENENKKSTKQDVEDKILKIERKKKDIIVYLSDNRFATRLGKKINSAFKGGRLEIKFSRLEDATRVYLDFSQ